MTFRRLGSIVQLAVFVIGGILGPVWHLAHHQRDHTHGAPHRSTTSLDTSKGWHSHTFDLTWAGEAEAPGHTHDSSPTGHDSNPPQTPVDHGRDSVAHFGLVLPGLLVLPAVPLPEQGAHVLVVDGVTARSLFHPPCPLQRPPPSLAA